MATEILMVKVRQCLKDLATLAEVISKSAENNEKYDEIISLIMDILGELAEDSPNSDKVEEACCNLKDVAKEYNDAGDNLDVKKASSGFASRIGSIKPSNYGEFLGILILEDKEDVLSKLAHPANTSSGDFAKMAWDCYQNKHYDEAFRYAQQAKDQKIPLGYYLMGLFYTEGIGTSKDLNAAYNAYLEGAQMGNADCQFQVYVFLFTGMGVSKNLESAYEWLAKAANNEHSLAMNEYAKMQILNGEYNDAYRWFMKAADAGDAEAKAWIGFCYEMGYGVERDINHAKTIYSQEISRGNEKAKEFYDNLIKSEKEAQERKRQQEEQKKRAEEEKARHEKERKRRMSHVLLWSLFLFLGALWAVYQFWYKDYRLDQDSPRRYVYATNLFLRSSAEADVEYNRIATLPYGSEVIAYSEENGWSYVKANGKKGYVSSAYLVAAEEFRRLNLAWGNENAKEAVSTAKCRVAMLVFLIDNDMQTGDAAWQLYTKPKKMKPNTVLYPSLADGYDHFTEFAFILKNNETGQRVLALYSFEEDETPVLRHTEDAPAEGDIKNITYNKKTGKYKVTYSNRKADYAPKPKKEPAEDPVAVTGNALSVVSAVFANTDFDRNVLTGFGNQLYSDMQYLTGKIYYRRQSASKETVTLQVKIIKPDGTVDRGGTSPTDYTFVQRLTLTEDEGVLDLIGWGNANGKAYAPGTYHYEIWLDGKRLCSKAIDIKERVSEETDVSDVEIYEIVE